MFKEPTLAPTVEALCDEQRDRWLKGERIPAEVFLERYEILQHDDQQALEVIYQEVLLREELGEQPQPAEYLERFPKYAEQLQALFEVHREIAALRGLGNFKQGEIGSRELFTVSRGGDSPSPDDSGRDTPHIFKEYAGIGASGSPPQIPGYEVLDLLGRGAMGAVYKARQTSLNRFVALKLMLAGTDAAPEEVTRIRREAETVARLQHPNVVQIYEVGEHQGRPYLALELVDGGSLAQRLGGAPLPRRQAAETVVQLARAMQYAHECNVIHRDLKPANVLVTSEDVPKIADFGLAKRLDSELSQTRTGAVLGTPSYMAPEQAEGRAKDVGPAADIYALGAILYELLTGRPPFRAATFWDTMEQVRSQPPAPPRLLQPGTPRDLETVCLKCLEKDPGRRYASARELAEELTRFLDGEPIHARSFNAWEHLVRTLDRQHHNAEFRAWGDLVLIFAPIALLTHVLVGVLVLQGFPMLWSGLLPLAAYFFFLFLLFRRPESRLLWPTNPVSRQFWAVMLGNVAAAALAPTLCRRLVSPDPPLDELAPYPLWCLVAGATFFCLGGMFWGRLFLLGLLCFLTAVVMTWNLAWAPFEYGAIAGLTHVVIGLHLRRLGRQAAPG
jgi:serine/threonine-protein kinase